MECLCPRIAKVDNLICNSNFRLFQLCDAVIYRRAISTRCMPPSYDKF